MSPLIGILLLAFVPNFASCGELTETVRMTHEKKALKRVRSILKQKGTEISDEAANEALISAIIRRRGKISKILINYASNANPEVKFSSEAIQSSLKYEMESTLDLLMTKNVDYNRLCQYSGRTFVFAAVTDHGYPWDSGERRLRMLEKLMQKKDHFDEGLLDIRDDGCYGDTALHKCANCDAYGARMMEVLLKAGAKINVTDIYDHTPMQYAINRGNVGCVKALIKYDPESSLKFARMNYYRNQKYILPMLEGYDIAARKGVKGAIYLKIYEKLSEFFHKQLKKNNEGLKIKN